MSEDLALQFRLVLFSPDEPDGRCVLQSCRHPVTPQVVEEVRDYNFCNISLTSSASSITAEAWKNPQVDTTPAYEPTLSELVADLFNRLAMFFPVQTKALFEAKCKLYGSHALYAESWKLGKEGDVVGALELINGALSRDGSVAKVHVEDVAGSLVRFNAQKPLILRKQEST